VWGAAADAAWYAASAAVRHRLEEAALAAGCHPGRVLRRSVDLAGDDENPDDWDVTDISTNAACVVAWRPVAELTGPAGAIWASDPETAWVTAFNTTWSRLGLVLTDLDVSLDRVVRRRRSP
jgi:hypothetical protein